MYISHTCFVKRAPFVLVFIDQLFWHVSTGDVISFLAVERVGGGQILVNINTEFICCGSTISSQSRASCSPRKLLKLKQGIFFYIFCHILNSYLKICILQECHWTSGERQQDAVRIWKQQQHKLNKLWKITRTLYKHCIIYNVI